MQMSRLCFALKRSRSHNLCKVFNLIQHTRAGWLVGWFAGGAPAEHNVFCTRLRFALGWARFTESNPRPGSLEVEIMAAAAGKKAS